jgi:hypothetical protein
MKGTRWSETRDALLEIADHAFQQDSAEVDIRFFNSSLVYRGIKVSFTLLLLPVRILIYISLVQGAGTVMSIFGRVEPKGRSTTSSLDEKLNHVVSR